MVALVIGVVFLGLQYIAYHGIISIHCGALKKCASNVAIGTVALEGILIAILANLSFSSSFLVGFTLGIRWARLPARAR